MKKDQKAKEELEGLSPFLARLRAKDSQEEEVPKDFFEQLPDDVFRRIRLEDQHAAAERVEENPGWLFWLLPRPQHRLALAFATLVLAAFVVVTLWPDNQGPEGTELAANELTAEDWQSYVADNIDEFDSELLWQAAQPSTEELDIPMEDPDAVLDHLLEDMSEEDLEEFFM